MYVELKEVSVSLLIHRRNHYSDVVIRDHVVLSARKTFVYTLLYPELFLEQKRHVNGHVVKRFHRHFVASDA